MAKKVRAGSRGKAKRPKKYAGVSGSRTNRVIRRRSSKQLGKKKGTGTKRRYRRQGLI